MPTMKIQLKGSQVAALNKLAALTDQNVGEVLQGALNLYGVAVKQMLKGNQISITDEKTIIAHIIGIWKNEDLILDKC